MYIYREGEQVVQREAFVICHDANGYIASGWISDRKMRKKERIAKNNPGRRITVDKSGGLTQSVEWAED